jgi:hypothetical protein
MAGNGSFFWFSNNKDSYTDIENDINKMEKKIISTHEYAEYDDRYQVIGVISLLFYLISFIYPTKEKN